MARTVELAFGADRSDPQSWVWTDVSADVLSRVVEIQTGIQDEMSTAQPGRCTVVLDNNTGKFTPGHPLSPHYPHVVEGTPMRVTVDGNIRFVGVVASWEPEWPHGDLAVTTDLDDDGWKLGDARVTVTATGVLGEIAAADTPLHSPLWRTIMAQPGLLAYWPLEDGEGAASGSSPVPGVSAAQIRSSVALGQDPVSAGSGPSALVTADVSADALPITCRVPDATEDGWAAESVLRIPDDTADGLIWRMSVWDETGAVWRVEATLADPDLTITLTWVDESGTSTQLASESIKRGTVHQIRLQADTQSGGRKWLVLVDDEVLDSGIAIGLTEPTAVGHVTQVGISAAGLLVGHVAVYEFEPGTTLEPEARQTFAAIGGWDGERAVARIWRLSHEEGLQPDVVGRLVGRDTFTRVEADDWGTSDSGQEWEIRTTAEAFAVNGSAGTMTGQGTFAFEGAYFGGIFNKYSDVDLRFTADIDGDGDTGCFVRIQESGGSTVGWIQVVVRVDGGARSVWIFRVGVLSETLGTAGDPGPGPWRMRVVAAGAWIACKVWPVSGDEPDGWTIAAYDPAYSRGAVGLMHFGVGVTSTFDDFELYTMDDSTLCGPQSIDTLISVMGDAAKVEAGGGWAPILTERRDALGLLARTRASMYNQDAKLSLDASDGAGDIVPPLLPVLDNRGKADAVIVTRTDGASVRRVVNTPIRRTVELDLDVHSDAQLPDLAGWAAAHTTWPGMRYPAVSPALAIVPALVADWVKLIPGDRIDLTGLPPQHPAGTVELMLLGTVEEIDANTSRGRAVCAPYGPYRVGVWQEVGATPDPDAPARYSPEDSQTVRPFDAGSDTELLVWDGTGGHDLWTTDAGAYPFDVAVSGVRLRAAGAGPAAADTFGRTVADGWGSPDVGPAWTLSGTAADFDVAAGVGTIAESSSLEGRWAVLDVEVGDFDLLVALSFSADDQPGGAGLAARVGADPSQDGYIVGLAPLAGMLQMGRFVGGATSELDTASFTIVAATTYWLRFVGHGSLLLAKAWADGTTEPQGWMVSAVDTSHAAGRVGVQHFGDGGSLVVAFDNFALRNPQRLTVAQAPVNGVVKTIPAGSKVELWRPARYAL